MNRRNGIYILMLLLLLFPCYGHAQEKESKIVRIGYVNVKGYEEGGEGEYKTGFGYEYFQKISYYTGWKYEYVYGSFSELIAMLENGEIDVLGNVTPTEERKAKMLFSSYPQGNESFYIVVDQSQGDLNSSQVEALNGLRIGVGKNTYQETLLNNFLSEKKIQADVVPLNGTREIVAAFEEGSIDAAAMTDSTDYGYVPVQLIGFHDFNFAVTNGRSDLLDELNMAMESIFREDPNYNTNVLKKYNKGPVQINYLTTDEMRWVKDHNNKIRIGFLKDNMPYSGVDADGNTTGIITMVMKNLTDTFGIEVEAVPYYSLQLMADDMKEGLIDCYGPAYGDYYISEQFDMIQTKAIFTTTPVILYRGELRTERIAACESSIFCEHVVEILYPNARVIPCSTIESCMELVEKGRADCTLITSGKLNLLHQYNSMRNLSYTELLRNAEICLFTNTGEVNLSTILDKAITLSGTQLGGASFVTGADGASTLSWKNYIMDYLAQVCIIVLVIVVGLILMILRMHKMRKMAEDRMKMTQAVSSLFYSTYYIDILNDSYVELSSTSYIRKGIGPTLSARKAIEAFYTNMTEPEFSQGLKEFMNLDTLDYRLGDKHFISKEYIGRDSGWSRAFLIEGDRDSDGRLHHVLYATRIIQGEKDLVEAKNKAIETVRNMAQQAEKDTLTGVYNRVGYNRIREEFRDIEMKMALLLVDADNFKMVNDGYGHEVGDEALVRIADLLKNHFRNEDFIFRYGGDEFMVLMPGITSRNQSVVANKIVNINAILSEESAQGRPKLSISVGVAFSEHGFSDDLFTQADRALYKTKEDGRCGCTFA